MTYAIGQVVFGVDLQQPYGSGPDECYFGVEKGDIAEVNTVRQHEIAELFTVTEADRLAYREKLDKLIADTDVMPEFRAKLEMIEPSLFITWGSS